MKYFKNHFIFLLSIFIFTCGGYFGGDGEEFNPPFSPILKTISNVTAPVISFTEDERNSNVVSFECKLNSNSWQENCTSPQIITGLDYGEHTFSVRAINSWGKIGETSTKTFRRGTLPKGINGTVNAMATLSDGSIVVGGSNFFFYQREEAPKIISIKKDGKSSGKCFSGTGFTGGNVEVIAEHEGYFYVGGGFTGYNGLSVGRIAKLDEFCQLDTDFNSNVGSVIDNTVYAVAIFGNELYLGGSFTKGILKFDTNGVLESESGGFNGNIDSGLNGTVYTIALSDDGSEIYVGGWFNQFDGKAINAFTGSNIIKLGRDGEFENGEGTFNYNINVGFYGIVYILKYHNEHLFAGGSFTGYGNVPAPPNCFIKIIADSGINRGRIETSGFNDALGTGFDDVIMDLTIWEDYIYLVGSSITFNGSPIANGVYKIGINGEIDEDFWKDKLGLYNSTPALVKRIIIDGNHLYVVGNFDQLHDDIYITKDIIKLHKNGDNDTTFQINGGIGTNAIVNGIAILGDNILMGGSFDHYGGKAATRILKFNSEGEFDSIFYEKTSSGFDNQVLAIAVDANDNIYIGGSFNANDLAANRITKLNSNGDVNLTFKNEMGTGFNGVINAINIDSFNNVYLGGTFTEFKSSQDNTPARIIKLSPQGLVDLTFKVNAKTLPGDGFDAAVNVIEIDVNNNIYVGGIFTAYSGNLADIPKGILKLNSQGQADSAFIVNATGLGDGFTGGAVIALNIKENKIFVGGEFTHYNGTPVDRLIKLNLDGTIDTLIGADGAVRSLKAYDGSLFVAGNLTGKIQQYDINTGLKNDDFSTNIDLGGDGVIMSILIKNNQIYFGGAFTNFNSKKRNRIGRLNLDGTLDEFFEGDGN